MTTKPALPTHHVVMFSGGVGSWATAKSVVHHKMGPGDRLTLLFADTLMEDPDLYRFLDDAAENVGGDLVKISDGRDPWQVFRDVRYLGNTRIDPCSFHLKRKIMRKWLEDNCDTATTVCYIGIDAGEAHRYEKSKRYWEPWAIEAPLVEEGVLFKSVLLDMLAEAGIEPPTLYADGFPHNNCGGFCIKGGIDHFTLLLRARPDTYAYHEAKEQEMREYLDKDVAILRDRSRKGILRRLGLTEDDLSLVETAPAYVDDEGEPHDAVSAWVVTATGAGLPSLVPLTLRELRERVEGRQDTGSDGTDIGGCNCVNPDAEVDAEIINLGMPSVPEREAS